MPLPNSESDLTAMVLAFLVNRSSAYLTKVGAGASLFSRGAVFLSFKSVQLAI